MKKHHLICMLVSVAATLTACDRPSPQLPADPIGEYPEWGQGFGADQEQPSGDSLLAPGGGTEGPAPTGDPDNAATTGSGGSVTPNQPNTFAGGDWSGGDKAHGQTVFLNECARCHRADGAGGPMPGVGMVPTLRDPAWHDRTNDGQIASTISHGKNAMPSFMQKLDKRDLQGVIAYIRGLKKQ